MTTVGWLIAGSLMLGQGLILFVKHVAKDNKYDLPEDQLSEIRWALDMMKLFDWRTKLLVIASIGGSSFSNAVVKIINLPFKNK